MVNLYTTVPNKLLQYVNSMHGLSIMYSFMYTTECMDSYGMHDRILYAHNMTCLNRLKGHIRLLSDFMVAIEVNGITLIKTLLATCTLVHQSM